MKCKWYTEKSGYTHLMLKGYPKASSTDYLDQRHFPEKFFENYRMSTLQFDDILNKIDPLVRKKDTNFRKAITPEEKLVLTLR